MVTVQLHEGSQHFVIICISGEKEKKENTNIWLLYAFSIKEGKNTSTC
jgi:hypothetical protein